MRSENFEEEREDLDTKFKIDAIIGKAEEKNKKIENCLEYLLINLYYIKDLREYCKNNLNKNNIQNNENYLFDAFSEFVLENMNNFGNNLNIGSSSNIRERVKNFMKIFYDKNLGENIIFEEGHENKGYQSLIEKIIDAFKNDIKIKNKNSNEPNNNNTVNKIEELFYGIKQSDNNEKEFFNTLYINPKKLRIDEKAQSINLNEIKNSLTLEKTGIIKLAEILILILDKDDIIKNIIPLELIVNIKNEQYNERYIFVSSIQNDESFSKFCSIIKKENKLYKIEYNSDNNSYKEVEISDLNEINKSSILFYKKIKEINYSSGYNNIYNSRNNIDLSMNPVGQTTKIVLNREGFHMSNL